VGSDHELAEELRARREDKLNDVQFRRSGPISYRAFVAEELEVMEGRLAPASLKELELVLRQFGGVCRNVLLADISPRLAERFFAQRLKSVAPATAKKSLRTLKGSLNRAARRGYLDRNPADGLKPVPEPERDVRVLTAEEIRKLLKACPSRRWRAMVALAVTTGMRLGELVNLTWDDVDLEDGLVRVRSKPGRPTKSRRNRVLALLPEIRAMLGRPSRR